jgi:hypothetical protein
MPRASNQDNGIVTRIWGPPLWVSLHAITFNYPRRPTKEDKSNYLAFFRSFKHTLPCRACRESYASFIGPRGRAPLSWKTMRDRRSVSRWLYDVHVLVNRRLKKPRGPSYETVKKRYEKYRAKSCDQRDIHGCVGEKDVRARVVIEPCPS